MMDVGWCLACSKATRDQRTPYCSEACRLSDTQPSSAFTEKQLITSPLPPSFIPLPPSSTVSRQPSDHRPAARTVAPREQRPPVMPLVGHSSTTSTVYSARHWRSRDRRAFSFPATENSDDGDRPSLPFVRKAKPVNTAARASKRSQYPYGDLSKLSRSTGSNTPNIEATFYSTSTSDSDEDVQDKREPASASPQRSPVAALSVLHPVPPLLVKSSKPPSPMVELSQAKSLASQLPTLAPTLDARPLASPAARMGSSSSRSREDIISWARGVGARDTTSTLRGSPCRRTHALSSLPPPSTEPLDEPCGTTPKGPGGAFSALNMTLGPVVNALRSVTVGTVSSPTQEHPSALGLQTVPAPAELSRVDVVVAIMPSEGDRSLHPELDTPALSTMSLSEAVDPSTTTDMGETIETATDDYSVISSHDRRPSSISARGSSTPVPPVSPPRRKSTLPLRPIQTTANAIWSLSTYLRSLAPFTTPFSLVSGPMADRPTTPATHSSELDSGIQASETTTVHAASPVPTSRMDSPEVQAERAERAELVRSVPMDIVIAPGSKAQALTEERQREREALEFLGGRSRTRSRSRRRTEASRSPSRSPSAPAATGRVEHRRPVAPRQTSYDADRSENGDESRRGRARNRGRGAPIATDRPAERVERPTERVERPSRRTERAEPAEDDGEERRGRRRDRGHESRDRSWSAVRGRNSRTRANGERAHRHDATQGTVRVC